MKVHHYREVAPLSVSRIEETTQGMTIRRVISEVDGATDFVMDVFEFEPGGRSELHSHPWEHQIFVVSGTGEIRGGGEVVRFGPGEVIFIGPDDEHQFLITGTDPVVFVCAVPKGALTAYYLDRGESGG
ncbi:MAG: cupin domain-containing protein [Acidimicrobiia bacterium]